MNSVATDVAQERRIVTSVPGPNSEALHARRQKVVSAGVSATYPIYISHAKGAILVDVDGNQYIDMGGGIGVTTIGHVDDAVVDAATERVLGVGIVGRDAGEMIAEGVLAVEMGALAQDLALTIHPHPTLSESEEEAAEAFLGAATHILPLKKH